MKTVKHCWNHAKILAASVSTEGPDVNVVNELKALLLEFSGQTGLGVEDILEHLTEQWTAAPEESDDEDAGLKAALQAREETDEKEADESEPVVPMTLCQARSAAQALKIFVQENQSVEAMRGYLKPIEDLVTDMEAMTVSVRTEQTHLEQFFAPVTAADVSAPSAGFGAQ